MSRRRKRSAPFSLFAFQDIITSVTGIMLVITMLLALELLERTDVAPPKATAAISKDLERSNESADREIGELEQRLQQQGERLSVAAGLSVEQLRRQVSETEDANRRLRNRTRKLRQRDRRTQERVETTRRQQESVRKRQDLLAEVVRQIGSKRLQLKKLRQFNRVFFNPAPGNPKKPWLVEISGRRMLVAESGVVRKPRSFVDVDTFMAWARQRQKRSEYFVLLLKPDGVELFREVKEGLEEAGFDLGFDLLSVGQTAIDAETGAGVKP